MLEVKNISKRFNDIKVLENISFTIKNGEIVGLIGPNGSGKSTLMKCILKLLKIDEGEITLNRKSIEDYDEQYFSLISGLIETADLYENLNGRDHIDFIKNYNSGIVSIDDIEGFINFNDNILKKKVGKYSFGMRQKLYLAMCFMKFKEGLILDEPTNGIDQESIKKFNNILSLVKRNGGFALISSHNFEDIEGVCDRFIFLKEGRIVEVLSKEDISNEKYLITTKFKDEIIEYLYKKEYVIKVEKIVDGVIISIYDNELMKLANDITSSKILIDGISQIKNNIKSNYSEIYKEELL